MTDDTPRAGAPPALLHLGDRLAHLSRLHHSLDRDLAAAGHGADGSPAYRVEYELTQLARAAAFLPVDAPAAAMVAVCAVCTSLVDLECVVGETNGRLRSRG